MHVIYIETGMNSADIVRCMAHRCETCVGMKEGFQDSQLYPSTSRYLYNDQSSAWTREYEGASSFSSPLRNGKLIMKTYSIVLPPDLAIS